MHDLQAIEQATLRLMDELGEQLLGRSLRALGWSFQLDRARRRMGSCRWARNGKAEKCITLSRPFSERNGWAVMEDVARHEIAHAMDYETRGRSDHGAAWKRWAVRCEADPSRLYEGEVAADTESRYVGVCPSCGAEVPYHRLLRRPTACRACCRLHNGGRYTDRFRLHLIERATGRRVDPQARALRSARPPKYIGTCPNCGGRIGFARAVKRSYACPACCDRYNGGKYDARFAYVIKKARRK